MRMNVKNGDVIHTNRCGMWRVFTHRFKGVKWFYGFDCEEVAANKGKLTDCKRVIHTINPEIDFERDGILMVSRKGLFGKVEEFISS